MILKAIKWLVYSNVWVSFSVVSFTYSCHLLGFFKLEPTYLLIVFFATLFAYNFQRLLKSHEVNPVSSERHIWINKNYNTVKLITVLAGVMGTSFALQFIPLELLFYTTPFILMVLLYAGNKWVKFPLRAIPFIKIVAISIVWTVVVYVFPAFKDSNALVSIDLTFLLVVFLFTFALCIPFDIRDLKSDAGVVKTIPSTFGLHFSKLLAVLMMLVCIGLSFMNHWSSIGVMAAIAIIPILWSNEKRAELFFTGLIDGLFTLIPLVHFALNY